MNSAIVKVTDSYASSPSQTDSTKPSSNNAADQLQFVYEFEQKFFSVVNTDSLQDQTPSEAFKNIRNAVDTANKEIVSEITGKTSDYDYFGLKSRNPQDQKLPSEAQAAVNQVQIAIRSEITGSSSELLRSRPPKAKIGFPTALRLYDMMNYAISQVAKSFAPPPPSQTERQGPSPATSHAGDLRQFVQDFARRFFASVGPVDLEDKTPVQAYSDLSKRAGEIEAKMLDDIQHGQSIYDYFELRSKSNRSGPQSAAVTIPIPPDALTALDQVQNAILSAVRSSVTEIVLESKAPALYQPPNDISCSVSIMQWQETSDTFGRRVANQFLGVQVTVRNLNTKYEFLMHDIQVAVDTGLSSDGYFWAEYAGRFQAGRDKLLVRSVAQRGQSEDRRNLVLNALTAAGAIAGSSAIAGSTDFKTGVAVFQGAFIPGFSAIFPDHTVEHLNHINDLTFSASNTSKVLVPIQGSVPLVTFIGVKPLEQLPFAWCGHLPPSAVHPCLYDDYDRRDTSYPHHAFQLRNEKADEYFTGKGWEPLSFKKWRPAARRILQNHLFVVIGGVHILQLTNEPPKIGNLDCPTLPGGALDITRTKNGVVPCTVTGTSLDKVSGVNLQSGNEKIAGKFTPAKDGNSAILEFDPSALSDGNGTYELYLVLTDQGAGTREQDSGEKVALQTQTFVASVDAQLDLGKTSTITLVGKRLDRIVHLYLVSPDQGLIQATEPLSSAKNGTELAGRFPTAGPLALAANTTYSLRYVVKDNLNKEINPPSLTVKTIGKATGQPAAPTSAAPQIKLSVLSGSVGALVKISGSNFGATQDASTVTFAGVKATPTLWSEANIEVRVPVGAKPGAVVVTVKGLESNRVQFTVLSVPVIKNLSTTSGKVGAPIDISGSNFGGSQTNSTVTFRGTKAAPTRWTATDILVTVPAGATTGDVVVTVRGIKSKGVNFTVLP